MSEEDVGKSEPVPEVKVEETPKDPIKDYLKNVFTNCKNSFSQDAEAADDIKKCCMDVIDKEIDQSEDFRVQAKTRLEDLFKFKEIKEE